MGFFDGMAGAATGGVLDLVGGIMTNNANKDIAAEANRFSAEQTQKQMDFQERMRKTQYQTSVEDLKAAGLNPMLAVSQGGAGTPAGASAVGQQARMENPLKGVASSAATLANIKADLDLKEETANRERSQATSNEKQAQYTDALTASEVMRMPNISQEFKRLYAQTLLFDSMRENNSANTAKTRQEYIIDEPAAWGAKTYGPIKQATQDFTQSISGAGQAYQSLRRKPGTNINYNYGLR